MSDDTTTEPLENDTPPEQPTQAWSTNDKRILLITIVGGLAANVGTVLVVGLAVIFLRLVSSRWGAQHSIGNITGAVNVSAGVVAGLVIWFRRRRSKQVFNLPLYIVNSIWISFGVVFLLVLVGLAAGIK